MTIAEVKPQYVFEQLQKGLEVVCVDFEKGEYISLDGQTVSTVQRLVEKTVCKFFTITEAS